MTELQLSYNPKSQYLWDENHATFDKKEINGKPVIKFHEMLWKQLKRIKDMKKKGWDSIVLIDGRRRSGKSTIAMTISFLLNPELSINNYVSGLEEAPDKIGNAKKGDVLIFDEGSLVGGSKDVMTKQSKQLHKIIDVIGQKQLTLLFCMPSFLGMSRPIVTEHAMFLIRVGVSKSSLKRGRFKFYKNKKMVRLYDMSKKDPKLSRKVKKSFDGRFHDFHLDFEEEYFKLKNQSMREAINPELVASVKVTPLQKTNEIEERNMKICKARHENPGLSIDAQAQSEMMSKRHLQNIIARNMSNFLAVKQKTMS